MLRDKFKQKHQQDEVKIIEPEIIIPNKVEKESSNNHGGMALKSGEFRDFIKVNIDEYARLRVVEKLTSRQAILKMCPDAKNWRKDVFTKRIDWLRQLSDYKLAKERLKNVKMKIVNKKMVKVGWDLEKATSTLVALVDAAKEIVEEDLKIKFRISPDGKTWLKDPDGNKIQRKRTISDSAARAILESVKELNKIYGLTKGDAPQENRYTQINFVNSELKE